MLQYHVLQHVLHPLLLLGRVGGVIAYQHMEGLALAATASTASPKRKRQQHEQRQAEAGESDVCFHRFVSFPDINSNVDSFPYNPTT